VHKDGVDEQALRRDRLSRICEQLQQRHYAVAVLFDPINIRYATDTTNMQVGRSPADYYLNLRLERAKNLLAHGHALIKQIAVACGFADTASFSRAFKRHTRKTPSEDRRAPVRIEVST
jgi:AraC-like DNA-binding protein